MVIFAVELFNGGNDIVIHYDDNYGIPHFVSRKVKNGFFKFNNDNWEVSQLSDMGITVL